jgi:FtsP/CotA-like multicopper oxidase with cupredoxin domain
VRLHACSIDFEVIMAFPIRPAAATAAHAACSKNKRWLRPIGIALAGLAFSGCATLSKDGGLDAVSALTRERTGHPVQRQAPSNGAVTTHPDIAGLLAQPLTPDSAVRIALANNRGLQAAFAELVVREMAPGMKANLWGYNGQSPGPTIEVVEGDRVRIFVTNRLPEETSIHWHELTVSRLQKLN